MNNPNKMINPLVGLGVLSGLGGLGAGMRLGDMPSMPGILGMQDMCNAMVTAAHSCKPFDDLTQESRDKASELILKLLSNYKKYNFEILSLVQYFPEQLIVDIMTHLDQNLERSMPQDFMAGYPSAIRQAAYKDALLLVEAKK